MRLKTLITGAAALAALLGAAPAHAVDGWTLVANVGSPGPVIDSGLNNQINALTSAVNSATKNVCTPKTTSLNIGTPRASTWAGTGTNLGEIDDQFFQDAWGSASKDCSNGVTVTTTICDYGTNTVDVPGGHPYQVCGSTASNTSNFNSTGAWGAKATGQDWVEEFGIGYDRGPSVLHAQSTGTYLNPITNKWTTFGQVCADTSVTPTPAGPQFGPTYTYSC